MNQIRSTFALVLVTCAAFTGCGSPPPPLAAESSPRAQPSPPPSYAESCPSAQVKGQPSQITLISSAEGVSFEPLETCGGSYPEYYIRVHGHGKRRIDYGRREPNECDKPDANAVTCPKVHFGAFGMSVLSAARAKLGQNNADSLGLGACTKLSAPSAQLDQWNMSFRVHDFRRADEALRIIDAELRRWDIGDDWGLSISGITCSSLQ